MYRFEKHDNRFTEGESEKEIEWKKKNFVVFPRKWQNNKARKYSFTEYTYKISWVTTKWIKRCILWASERKSKLRKILIFKNMEKKGVQRRDKQTKWQN